MSPFLLSHKSTIPPDELVANQELGYSHAVLGEVQVADGSAPVPVDGEPSTVQLAAL
ncbi:hypothetical protein M378DRAFT_18544 [Amanita muscaria Koide BX008]|uniref:Uncharacterized protein n=1 Tax=Amanita muscaria (strain Koide BX008) TaxID=946122 RepID=A0A0C2WF98_AMAMK|nr:hypothetical protein M378DRAFT_18544 [Amanita muscaria Koide BX008]